MTGIVEALLAGIPGQLSSNAKAYNSTAVHAPAQAVAQTRPVSPCHRCERSGHSLAARNLARAS